MRVEGGGRFLHLDALLGDLDGDLLDQLAGEVTELSLTDLVLDLVSLGSEFHAVNLGSLLLELLGLVTASAGGDLVDGEAHLVVTGRVLESSLLEDNVLLGHGTFLGSELLGLALVLAAGAGSSQLLLLLLLGALGFLDLLTGAGAGVAGLLGAVLDSLLGSGLTAESLAFLGGGAGRRGGAGRVLAGLLLAVSGLVKTALLLLFGVVLSALVDVGEETVSLLGGLLFLADLALDLLVDLALGAGVSVQGLESVGGDEEGAGAQGEVLGAAHISDLLVVEVTADSAGAVTEDVVSVEDDALTVGGDLDATSDDLDSAVGHLHDLGDGVLLSRDGGGDDGGKLDFLVVDGDEDLLVAHA